MLIPFKDIVKKYGINPKGVLHVGASTGQECETYYANGVERTIWIEAIVPVFIKLRDHVSKYPNAKCFNECVWNEDNKIMEFNISNNGGESSSLLKFGVHKEMHPDVIFDDYDTFLTKRLDTILKDTDLSGFDFLNIDLQGAELPALKSLGDLLNGFKYVYCEVNKAETYEGCALVGEIDEYLAEFGFKGVEERWVSHGGKEIWGDKYFMK